MPESDPSPDDRPSPIAWPKFQFSLRSQLIAVAIVAVILGLFVTVGQSFAQLAYYGILGCLLPTPLVICAIWERRASHLFDRIAGAVADFCPSAAVDDSLAVSDAGVTFRFDARISSIHADFGGCVWSLGGGYPAMD